MNNSKGLLILCLSLATFGVESAWGTKYYSKAKAIVSSNSSGMGLVYVAQNEQTYDKITDWESNECKTSSNKEEEKPTYYYYAKPYNGYGFLGWSSNDNETSYESESTSWNYSETVTSGDKENPIWIIKYANFDISSAEVTTNVGVTAQDPATSVPGSVVFTVSNADTLDDFNKPESIATTSGIGSFSVGDWSYADGKITINYTYNPNNTSKETQGKLELVSAGGEDTCTATIIGNANKKTTTIVWDVPSFILNKDEEISDPAHAENGATVKYKIKDGQPTNVIDLSGSTLMGLEEGTCVIIAYLDGDEELWAYQESEKTFTVTNKQIPTIDWSQKLSFNYSGTKITEQLKATAETNITYSIPSEAASWASINGNTLTITGTGETTITATAAETDEYIGVSVTRTLIARDPTATCDDYIYDDGNSHKFSAFGGNHTTGTFSKHPRSIKFQACKSGALAVGYLQIDEYYSGGWHKVSTIDVDDLAKDNLKDFGPYDLNYYTTQVKFTCSSTTGIVSYKRTVKNIKVLQAKRISANVSEIKLEGQLGTQKSYTFNISYDNVQGPLYVTCDETSIICPSELVADCGDAAVDVPVTITLNPTTSFSRKTLTISDQKNGGRTLTIPISATVEKNDLSIFWNPNTTDKKNHGEVMTMKATSYNIDYDHYPITFTSSNPDYAVVNGNQVTFLAAGAGKQVTITASQEESNTYKSASLSKTFIIKEAQSISFNDSIVNVSIGEDKEYIENLFTLKTAQIGDGVITYAVKSGEGGVIDGSTFYGSVANDVVITATAARTADYETVSQDFTIHVVKRTPTISWKTFELEHIYAGEILDSVASTFYKDKPVALNKTYSIVFGPLTVDVDDNAKIHVDPITAPDTAEVKVTTEETAYYKSVEATHFYPLEPKRTPVFKLNGDTLSTETTTDLYLEIGDTANVSFELTDESQFEYPQTTANNYFSYEHDAVNHTGVITATKFGNETFAFHQKGTATIFDHTCNLHIYVSKHQSSLSTPLVDGTWKVDSLYTGPIYSSNDSHEVIISSSDDKVLKLTDEGLKAVGAGIATLYIRQAATDAWTGDTISVNITVEKYTPEISWNMDVNLPWGSIIENPIFTTNTELPYSITSSNSSIADYKNERIEVYNTSGTVTFTFVQNGNYKWNSANSSKIITVFQPANHVPFTLSQSNYGNFVNSYNKEYAWDAGLRVASTAAKYAFNWDDRYVILHFEGIPDKLYFSCSNSTASTGIDFYVCEGPSQSSLSQIWSASEAEKDVQLQLQPNTRYVKLCFSGNYAGYFSNVKVTERKEIVAPASCDFGAANVGAGASKKTISVDWYNVQTCTLTITGTNADLFSANTPTIASSLDNYGKADIEVSYVHTKNGSHSATLTIQSADGKSATINLSGTSNKITPTITWKENLSPMEKGSSIENPAQAAGLTFSYESSDPTVIEIINGNTLHALKKGFADITATFDGTNDVTWNSASDTTTVEVTDIKVLRIDWPQSFTNLKTDKPDITIKAEVYYYNFDDSTTVAIDRPITFTSQNTDVVTIVNGAVHIVGKGETTITAMVEGEEDEYMGTTVTRKVRVREPSEGCDVYVLEDASGSLFTEITSFSGVEKELVLSGEPGSITFDAWSEKWYAINPSGNLKVAEYYNGSYHTIWDQTLNVGSETSYGPIALNRKTTKIKFFKEVGSTCYHNFASAYVTLAKYLELDNTAGKTTMTVDFPESETSTDVTYTKYVDVNFSNITDVLDVYIENGTNFSVLKQDLSGAIENIETDCGDKGKVTIAIQFLANEVKNYSDKITISNKDQSVTINLTAEVARHDQQITWNPTTDLLTTDQVSFSATTTATDLNVTYAIKGTSDVASVTPDGNLTIYKSGEVTIVASQAGSEVYKPADDVEKTFTISRVTPTITTLPVASEVVLPKTLANCTLTGGEASVEGVFAWTNSTTSIERGNTGYEVTFTPSNLNYYTPTTCIVVVPVAKDPQTITWNFSETTMFCNADITFNATASSGLKVKYATSDASIAYVDDANHLNIIKGGEVTITAQQEGDITWAVAPEVSKHLTIQRFTPTIVEVPTASSMLIGQLISNSVLTGGRAELNNEFVAGTYAWKNSNTATIDVAGKTTHIVIFSPQNSNYYNSTTCEVVVEVKKYAPTVTHNLTATAITYGQSLNESVLSGTLTAMDMVKYPSEEVDGTYTWKEPTKQLEAGNHSEVVRFTPTNLDWYDVVDVEVPVVVNKAHATNATAVVNMLYGQTLEEVLPINTTADAVSGIVEGTITWGASVDLNTMPTMGEHDYSIHMAVTDPNYVAETIDGTCHVTVEKGFVFDGHGGSTEWSATGNWLNGEQPNTEDAKVIVTADATIINSEVIVGAITIKQGANVTIEKNGVLNVGDIDCVSRKEYGNMIIKQGGKLNLNEGEVQVNDFTLEAALGGIIDNAHVDARSGQVTNAAQLVVNGNAYFEIALDANGECTQGWYDFTVPFPVNALSGVQRYENEVLQTNLKNEVNYAIMSYHEDVRAQGKYGWSKYRGIMQPGQCYSITIDNYYNVYRFVKTADGALNTSNEVQITATDGGANVDKGWNGIGNGTLSYANITASDIDKVQVYDHATNSYSPVEISNTTFVVGSSFFVQTPQTESVVYNKANTIGQLYAPKQTSQVSEEFVVTLSKTSTQSEVDRLYLSATEDAIDSYEIGHDLAKFEVSSSVAQMWCSAYNMKLCDVELPLEYETALFPITFSAPKPGEYTLSVAKTRSNDKLYLLYQGDRVAELTMSDYVVELDKGTDTNYALQIVSTNQAPTQMENNEQTNVARKVIIDNQLYIFYDKKVYDITGKCIK